MPSYIISWSILQRGTGSLSKTGVFVWKYCWMWRMLANCVRMVTLSTLCLPSTPKGIWCENMYVCSMCVCIYLLLAVTRSRCSTLTREVLGSIRGSGSLFCEFFSVFLIKHNVPLIWLVSDMSTDLPPVTLWDLISSTNVGVWVHINVYLCLPLRYMSLTTLFLYNK